MDHDTAEPEGLAALQLVGEDVHRLAPGRVVRRAQIDQVAGVSEDGGRAGGPPRGGERTDVLVGHGLGCPLALVLQEDLHGATRELGTTLERAMERSEERRVGKGWR